MQIVAAKKPSKPAPKGPKNPKCYMPTQQEIAEKCAEIRSRWSEDTEKMRRVQKSPDVEARSTRSHRPERMTSN